MKCSFLQKCLKFLHVLFNLVVKHCPDKRANRGRKKTQGKIQDLNRHSKKNYPPHTRAFITCATSTCTCNNKGASLRSLCRPCYFVPVFLRNKVQHGQKNTGVCFTTKLKSTCKNSRIFEEKNSVFPRIKSSHRGQCN